MALAHLAGIDILATGGIGGVHRDAEISMDISADLIELGRTPVAVVSSGCKSFLDIPRTLEYLETHGVAVGTFRDGSDAGVEFPAFWSRESGILSPSVIEDEKHAAAMICMYSSPNKYHQLISYHRRTALVIYIIGIALCKSYTSGFIDSENNVRRHH